MQAPSLDPEPGDGPLPGDEPGAAMTLEEVARELGVSKITIYRIERRALRKLRRVMQRRGLELTDLIPNG